jgi:hypothetical protein
MKFMTMVKSSEKFTNPPQGLSDAVAQAMGDGFMSGRIVGGGGLMKSEFGARVRLDGGKITIIDGPFTEAKELIGGYAIYNVKSKAEIIEEARVFMELTRKHWPGWTGESEIRQIFDDETPKG